MLIKLVYIQKPYCSIVLASSSMIQRIHKRKKPIVLFFISILLVQISAPTTLWALTSGPTQPEFSGFTAVGTSDMVNLFTGNLNYSIPLFDLPGPGGSYPFTLSYQSGITMDQEASWVGLGWSLNAGAISRQMRGLPDEYKGDVVTTKNDMKPNITWDFGIGADYELVAKPKKPTSTHMDTSKISSFGSISLGHKFSHNTYRGWDAGLELGLSILPFNMGGFGFNAGLSTSVIEGSSISAGFCYANERETVANSYSLGTSVNSRQGLTNLNLGYSHTNKVDHLPTAFGHSSSFGASFERRSFIPSNDIRYKGQSYDASVEIGALLGVPHLGGRVNVGYSRQEIDRRGKPIELNGFGYLYSKERKKGNTFLMDINRMGEAALHKFTQNLATCSTTPDIFSVSGSGLNTVFRPYRSDVGIYSDPNISSLFTAANVGFDINPTGYVDVGINVGARYAKSFNSIWPVKGMGIDSFNFIPETINSDYRQVYFKIPGEQTADSVSSYDYILKDKTVRIGLNSTEIEPQTKLESEGGSSMVINKGARTSREAISTSIQHITNKELVTPIGLSRKEYTAWIYDPERKTLERNLDSAHHIAGFELVNTDGLRYIYGLPVKNKEHREYLFSVSPPGIACSSEVPVETSSNGIDYKKSNTDEFYQEKELSTYTHSHLLTAILGPDFSDIDTIAGPSDGDIGFWVRFEYEKVSDYAWRAPYSNASYLRGSAVSTRDDKASFMYGVREQYYLLYAETRTHRAEFITEDKLDARGAASELTGMGDVQARTKKLTGIHLYSKFDNLDQEANALKRIHFSYDSLNPLCPGAPNTGGTGKLTLKSLAFSYERSIEGMATPYQFEYDTINPEYNTRNQDRWGRYQTMTNACLSQEYSFSRQDETEAKTNASAWHLNKIVLPSGAEINIEYEPDEYMHVQDREAMQLFQITRVDSVNHPLQIKNPKNGPYKVFFDAGEEYSFDDTTDVVPFLKNIHGLELDTAGKIINSKESQLYFKVNMNIKSGISDYFSGYAKIEKYGIEDGQPYIQLAPFKLGNADYHPFCAAAWQKMKIEYPHIISKAEFEDNNQSFKEVIGLFMASLGEIGSVFRSFFTTCHSQRLATEINPELSFIRLSYPGTGKIGGDSRVKEISLNDNWGDPITLGQTYDYNIQDESGRLVSSGVAENEPSIGYEECPLRFAKLYNKQLPVHAAEALMFEFPINEAYLPGANIGYRKVTVRSLGTSKQKEANSELPENFSTTGRTVHEFYTAKDFPILFDETALEKHFPSTPIWSSLFSSIQKQAYSGSQGYSIITNDMHGKPFRITHYGEDKMNREQQVILNKTEYTYYEDDVKVTHELGKFRTQRTLKNDLKALVEYGPDPAFDTSLHIRNMEFGVDREFFTDLRYTNTLGTSVKTGPNIIFSVLVSIFGIPLPIPGSFVSITKSENQTKTAVANKIISKTGILKQVDVYDGQSHLRTNNLVFDKFTGEPILTSVNNAFDKKIYSLNLPAHYTYDGMGASFQNYRLNFEAHISELEECTGWYILDNLINGMDTLLKEEDELLLLQNDEVMHSFIIQEIDGAVVKGSSPFAIENGNYNCLIIRSGARNLLRQPALQVSAICDPTIDIFTDQPYNFNINTPSGQESSSFLPIYIDSVISAKATTYSKQGSPNEEICTNYNDLYCACVYARIKCDGDCYGRAVLGYVNGLGDTIILDTSVSCFNCDTEGTIDSVWFQCNSYSNSWDLFAEITPMQCTAGVMPPFDSCTYEMESLELVIIEVGCGSRPGMPMHPLENPYNLLSEAGGNHWVPKSTYIYTDARRLSSLDPTVELDLLQEGIVSRLPLFEYNNPFFTQNQVGKKWVQSSYLLETGVMGNLEHEQNAIGVSSVLFRGYAELNSLSPLGNVPILVVQNATPYDVAFEGFEEDIWESNAPSYGHSTSNFTFGNDVSPSLREKHRILGGLNGTPNSIIISKPFDVSDSLPSYIILDVKSDEGSESKYVTCEVWNQDSVEISLYDDNVLLPYTYGTKYTISWPNDCPSLPGLNSGDATIVFIGETETVAGSRTSSYAHTGKYSFLPQRHEGRGQTSLNLLKGKDYILEGWIFNPDDAFRQVPSYPEIGYIFLTDNSNVYEAKPIGEIIEGWQQIQCAFTASGGPVSVNFTHFIDPFKERIYFDDLRISPISASVKSYVYNPDKMRLIAELDENNYATLYSYDDEGKLVIVRKETDRGIMTIRESRNHLHPEQ
jgi:hypothetical protein